MQLGWLIAALAVTVLATDTLIQPNDLTTFTFRNNTRKVYPLDRDAVYPGLGE